MVNTYEYTPEVGQAGWQRVVVGYPRLPQDTSGKPSERNLRDAFAELAQVLIFKDCEDQLLVFV
eukprot:2622683-Pyramimonas_sp.AAC.1